MFELQSQTIKDLRESRSFYVDAVTYHVFWLHKYHLLCAPWNKDGYVDMDQMVNTALEDVCYHDLAARNSQIEAILWRRRGEEALALRAEAEARLHKKQARYYPEKCAWLLPAADAEEYM